VSETGAGIARAARVGSTRQETNATAVLL